jgi:serine/threonine protein kinase/tetratricopeptide (TPR) repeat protein
MTKKVDDNQKHNLEEALEQYVDSKLRGREPDLEKLVKQYPGQEHLIRAKLGKLQKINNLFDSLAQTDESEFENAEVEHDLVGRKVGSFEIVEIIGRGGMGVVYLARDTRLKRSVAIKSMPAKLAADSTARTRFRREAELLASLNHPNIAVIHEIIEEEKSGYLVLEYVPGETLFERIAREPLEFDEALSIGRQIVEAVSAAHKKGIVHRDLKPGNIKITPEGRVKVLDFGLAKVSISEGKDTEATVTHPGRVIGTPAYMSPEQARGKETDHRTDIWSFGCIMYQMLTGHLPFEGETATDTLARIIEREPEWEMLPQNTPTKIRNLLHRCLEKNFDRRLGDIAEVVVEINETITNPKIAPTAKLQKTVMVISVFVICLILSIIALKFIPQKEIGLDSKEIRLVVLPFENLNPAEQEWFADGITDEITARLGGIHGLAVISRQSAMQYKNKKITAPQIAKELNVDYILEGTVQLERPSDPNGRVKIRPQLIKVADDSHVWADIYENNMSEIFRLQSEVAEQVVQALNITLLEPERQLLASIPTKNTEAYNYYMRGNEYSSRPFADENNLKIAVQMYEEAVRLDDKFALAHAKLSVAYSGMYHFGDDRTEQRLSMALDQANRALKLDPELPEAHWALGVYYYWGRSDYVRALDEFQIALKSRPKNSQFLAMIGYMQRAQGKLEQALPYLKKAFEHNPLDYNLAFELGNTYRDMRKYSRAEPYYEQAILLAPDENFPYYLKAKLYLVWKGRTKEARDVLERASEYINLAEVPRMVELLFRFDVLDKKYEEALARLPLFSPSTDELTFLDALRYAQIYEYMGKTALAKKYCDKARSILEPQVKKYPNSRPGRHSRLGIAYAGLGPKFKEDAIREGKKAVELVHNNKDSQSYFSAARDLAYVYIKVSEFDAAIDQIEYMLSFPGLLSIPLLQLDPAWDPLRDHPRFKKLIEKGIKN